MEHLIYAPGWYTGYGAKTMPGPREAIEERRYGDADVQIARVARAIEDEAALVEHVAAELEATFGTALSSSNGVAQLHSDGDDARANMHRNEFH